MIPILRRWGEDKKFQASVLGVSALVVFVTLLSTAWIAEDAHITFRTIDNFVNGYGLR